MFFKHRGFFQIIEMAILALNDTNGIQLLVITVSSVALNIGASLWQTFLIKLVKGHSVGTSFNP